MANEYGNYCTLNALSPNLSNKTLSNGNLSIASTNASAPYSVRGTIAAPNSGRWKMFEFTNKGNYSIAVGIIDVSLSDDGNDVSNTGGSYGYYNNGQKYVNGTGSSYGDAFNSDGKIITCIIDYDAATVEFFLDNSSQGTIAINATVNYVPFWWNATSGGNGIFNFGATDFAYSNSSYLPINTANLPTPAIINPDDHFCSVVIDHDGSDTDGTCTFNLDTYEWLAFIKNTTGAVEKWYWINSLDGVNKYLDQAGSALVTDANVMSVSGTTFTLGSTLGNKSYLVEFHKAGLASATAANTSGTENTIATSENATSGFGMAQFASPSSGNFSIGHGFSVALSYVVTNETSRASSWLNWHTSLNGGSPGTTYRLNQNTTTAQTSTANYWGSTGMTSTVMGYGTAVSLAASQNVTVFYWHGVDGYSSYGSYEGNGNADGPMISTNFSAGSSFFKTIDATDAWSLYPPVLSDGNPDNRLAFNNTALPATDRPLDTLSNGLKVRTSNGVTNPSSTVIYGAWGGRSLTDGGVNQGRAR